MNFLIPMAGESQYFPEKEYPFPRPLIEINGKTIIELVVGNFSKFAEDINMIFVINKNDCRNFHLDNTINVLTKNKGRVVILDGETKGALCSALMAIAHVDSSRPLVIANADQIFEDSIVDLVSNFSNADAGVLTFESVHPRWSYVRTDRDSNVIESSEKKPISNQAIAGLYYFKNPNDFFKSATNVIRKESNINGKYYISSALNELILDGKTIKSKIINSSRYHTFYSPSKIKRYESEELMKRYEDMRKDLE
jgi:dTDP-glucose pyrophosphorylase